MYGKALNILEFLLTEFEHDIKYAEFEYLDMDLLAYYIAEDMDEGELEESKPLPENVSREEYMWKWTIPQIKLASIDFTHVKYTDDKKKKSDIFDGSQPINDLGIPIL